MSKLQKQQPQQQWYQHLNIDLLARVLGRSIFHPAIVLVFYLCIAAIHKHREPVAFYTLYWAGFLAFIDLLGWLNHRLSYGPALPRPPNFWEDQVVLITGGASGLGRVLADSLVRRRIKVAILDVRPADGEAADLIESGGDLVWEVCDITQLDQVKHAVDTVVVQSLGPPTILINNAAALVHACPLLDLSSLSSSHSSSSALTPDQANKTLQVNTLGHFNLLHVCLPHLIATANATGAGAGAGAYIVSISSILAQLAPASLADYVASKAGASAIHHSLQHELAQQNSTGKVASTGKAGKSTNNANKIKTLLVETGQIDTPLFANVTKLPWYANFFAPVLDPKDVADAIINVLSRGEGGVLRMPLYASLVGAGWYAILPGSVQRLARWLSGIDAAVVVSSASDHPPKPRQEVVTRS